METTNLNYTSKDIDTLEISMEFREELLSKRDDWIKKYRNNMIYESIAMIIASIISSLLSLLTVDIAIFATAMVLYAIWNTYYVTTKEYLCVPYNKIITNPITSIQE